MSTPNETQIKAAYKTADAKGKKILVELYGKEMFQEKKDPIGKGITTFAQVLTAMKKKSVDYAIPTKGSNQAKADAYMKRLKLIAKCFNDGWVADMADTNQYKYWAWFDIIKDASKLAGFGFSNANYYCVFTYAYVGSRPNFKSSEIAIYVGETFIDEFEQFAQYQQLADKEI